MRKTALFVSKVNITISSLINNKKEYVKSYNTIDIELVSSSNNNDFCSKDIYNNR